MSWDLRTRQFKNYLKLERSLADNSIEAYLSDLSKLKSFLVTRRRESTPAIVAQQDLIDFLEFLSELGTSPPSQARIISGLRTFFKYLVYEGIIDSDPSELIEAPRLGRKLPDTLDLHEIEELLAAIDLSKPEGTRNRAMLEVLYSSGLRVTELTALKISHVYDDIGFLRVIGKGSKERLVPVGKEALKHVRLYKEHVRTHISVQKGF